MLKRRQFTDPLRVTRRDYSVLLRGFIVWLVIIFAEFLHGTARIIWLEPLVGDFRARQISVFTGSVMILAIALIFIRWIRATSAAQLLQVGLLWLVLTVGFEILLGRLVMQLSWQRILSDYNLLQGGLMPIGLLILTLGPILAAKLKRLDPMHSKQ
ncbi:MAG: hypothetical protein HC780_01245 [Leptolyngbyaceae cyanobacterium CSU_1_3]|nr:hypothetical protein [Leptolyngbyaceae cyanobacterium CSU_1_3]